MGDRFFLGICSNCHQRSEVHEGSDGRAYCEDCLVMLGKDKESQISQNQQDKISIRQEVLVPKTPFQENKRNELIDWIVSHADNNWIDKFLQSTKQNYAWVSLIEQEQNERVLLRLAVELGYPKGYDITSSPSHRTVLDFPKTFIDKKDNGQTKENRSDKRNRGRPKGSSNRTPAEKTSKPVSLSNP